MICSRFERLPHAAGELELREIAVNPTMGIIFNKGERPCFKRQLLAAVICLAIDRY